MLKAMLLPLFLGMFLSASLAEDIVGCTPEEVVGKWTFHLDEGGHDEYFDCRYTTKYVSTFEVELLYPNKAVDIYGNEGKWTMMEYLGFEVVIHGRKYYSHLDNVPLIVGVGALLCNETEIGHSHDVMNRNWACYRGKKSSASPVKSIPFGGPDNGENDHMMYKADESLIEKINSDDSIFWTAKKYEEFEKMTIGQMKQLMGQKSHLKSIKPSVANQTLKNEASKLPKHFDWRNVNGVNYISPVRDQVLDHIRCACCYAMASAGMSEARLNIASGGTINVTLSPQDVVDCNRYTTGCGGGFEFEAAGKFAEEFGLVEESCHPYKAQYRYCDYEKRNKCKKYYFTDYEYVGGFLGACSEEAMMLALRNGPITSGIRSSDEFKHYAGGIYHDTGLQPNTYVITNHSILIVGYGIEESTNTKYWIVKNSWGEKWGENGYFRIRRGTNEIGIETSAFQNFPIF